MSVTQLRGTAGVAGEVGAVTRFEPSIHVVHAPAVAQARTARWPWALAVIALVVYVAVGLWMVYGIDYAIGDAIARASGARAISHSRDQHVMAFGFYWAPFPGWAQVPFMAVASRLGYAEAAICLPTATATALTIPVLARLAAHYSIPRRWSIVVVALFALNPYTVFLAASGMSEPWYHLFLAGACLSYVRWTATHRSRDLGALGLWLAFGQLTRHEFLLTVVLFTAAVAWQAPRKRRVASAVTVALPALFAIAVWTLTSIIIIGEPFWSVIDAAGDGRLPIAAIPGEHTVSASLRFVGELALRFGPGLVVLAIAGGLPAELAGQLHRDQARRRALVVTPLVLAAAYIPALQFRLVRAYNTYGDPRYFSSLIVLSFVIGLIALGKARWRPVVGAAVVAAAAVGCITGYRTLADPKWSAIVGEPLVVREFERSLGIRSGPAAEDGSASNLVVWRNLARDVDPYLTKDKVLVVDSVVSHGFLLLTDRPSRVATDRDKTFEQSVTGSTRAYYEFALVKPDDPSIYNQQIIAMLRNSSRGDMRWYKVDLASATALGMELWELKAPPPVEAPAPAPTVEPAAETETDEPVGQPGIDAGVDD